MLNGNECDVRFELILIMDIGTEWFYIDYV